MKKLLLAGAVAIALGGIAQAAEVLNGTYAFVGQNHCILTSPSGVFSANQSIGFGLAMNAGVQGFITYNKASGTGTGSLIGTLAHLEFDSSGLLDPVNGLAVGTTQENWSLTFTVSGDEFTATDGTINGTFTSGPQKGVTYTITGVPPFNGIISENEPHVLQTANSQPTVAVWKLSNGAVRNVLCSRTRTLTKVKETPPATN